MSRTYQYRKVMKPMLERKRRARMNKCLDDLKDLMVGALQHEGESITKLEKADVLELTVTHLKKLKRHNALSLPTASHSQEKFTNGFRQCTSEVTKFINSCQGIDIHVSNRLLGHLGGCLNSLDKFSSGTQSPIQTSSPSTPPASPITVSIPSKMYTPPASPDNSRQISPVSNHLINTASPPSSVSKSSVHQSYNVRAPLQIQQTLVVPGPIINNTNITNINYKITSNQHYQQLQQQQQQQQTRYHQHNIPSPAPPTPPLSTCAPSPVHHHLQPHVSPKPTLVISPPVVQQVAHNIHIADDSSVWRPW